MPSDDALPLDCLPAAPLIIGSLVKPAVQSVKVDLQDKNVIEQVDELREVP
jgi:hypothetical protein